MSLSYNSFSLMMIVTLTLLAISKPITNAQNSPTDYLNAHNQPRSIVNVTNINWNNTLAIYAQTYSNSLTTTCNLVHSNGPYGENLAKGSSNGFTGVTAVNLWVAEKTYYTYSSNTCQTGKVCGHYTQVVWASSVQVGCGRVQCVNGWYLVTCSYYPPGNYVGEWPY